MLSAMLASNHMGKSKAPTSDATCLTHQHLPLSLSISAKPYSNFKPGQTTLDRDYYGAATQEKPSGEKCLGNYQRFGSDYNKGVSTAVKPGDYVVPSKDANNLSK